MNIARILLALCFLGTSVSGQKVSDLPPKTVVADSDLFLIYVPGLGGYKLTMINLASNLNGLITVTATVTNAVASGSNLATTNATSFGVFYQVSNLTNMQFFNVKQGTNMVIYRDGSNIVLNATGTGSGAAAGSTYQVQLNTNNVFTALPTLNYHPVNFFRTGIGPTLDVSDGFGDTNFMDGNGFGSLSGQISFYTSNAVTKWNMTARGDLVPFIASTYDVGSFDYPTRTNWALSIAISSNLTVGGAIAMAIGSPSAGQVPTFRSDGTLYPSNVVAAGSGGTNYPPVTATGTNIAVGTGVTKSLLMPTNAGVAISFNGTEILGETLTLVVTNTSATASNITISFFQDGSSSTYFDATVASNVTGFLVVSNSSKKMQFVYNGSFWRVESTLAKEMELAVAGGLSLATNSSQSIVTLSNSLALQQLNNVGIGTPAANDVLLWSAALSKWTNSVVPGSDIVSNITVSATNNVMLDFGAANIFKLMLLTNWTETFTNVTSLTKKGYVYYQQDTNGNRMLNNYYVAGGLLQTNAAQNMQPTTNASALDLLELMPGFFTTNLIAWWPQDFQPRIKFTNSLHAFASFLDSFNRSNSDPMSTTASDGHTWTSGPGALAEPRIISSMLFGNAGQTGARVLTPTMGGNHSASMTLIGNTGHMGPMVRMQSTSDASGYILVSSDATHLTIYTLTDTGSLALSAIFTSSATPVISNGDTITLTVNGTTLECFLNGVSYGTISDATFSGGQPGVWMDSDTASGGPFSAIEQ